ncbi:hypothetical protein BsWGS_10637 [Bradybaena similaris]
MACDIQLLIQASLYFAIFVLNFIVAIPIGVNVIELNDQCMLYTDITWVNVTFFRCQLSDGSTCHFPVYVAVVSIFYSLLMGIYNMYVVCRSKDPHIGYQMWVLPSIVLTSLITILMLVISCILSVGIKSTCDQFLKMQDKNPFIHSCSDIEGFKGREGLPVDFFRHIYSYPKTSEVASWITFLVWTTQACLFLFRLYRNRRAISKSRTAEPLPPDATQKSSDLSNFASVQPAAL